MSREAALRSVPRLRRLRLSPTLTGYIARRFTARFISFFLGLLGVILLVTLVDLLDRAANKEHAGFGLVVEMAFLKLPHLSQEIMPFTVLFAGLATFWRLTKSNELVVARGAGVSVWQFMLPAILVALLVGIVTMTVLNPLASILLKRYEQLEARYLSHGASTLAIKKTGLWLRQADTTGQSVIHAVRASPDILTLYDVIIWRFEEEDKFAARIDAQRAELRKGYWRLFEAWSSAPGSQTEFNEQIDIGTDLTAAKIQESFAPPETVSFWALPGFIKILEQAGFSGQRHKLQLHRLMASPLLLAGMVLIAATFSLRPQRRGRVGLVILAGIAAGFLLYFLSNFVFALGVSGKIPVVLAGWTPAGVSLMLGSATLLHLEDG